MKYIEEILILIWLREFARFDFKWWHDRMVAQWLLFIY